MAIAEPAVRSWGFCRRCHPPPWSSPAPRRGGRDASARASAMGRAGWTCLSPSGWWKAVTGLCRERDAAEGVLL